MADASRRYRRNDRFLMRRFGEEGLLVPLAVEPVEAGNLFSLNPLGIEIWEHLEGRTFGELCAWIGERYDAAPETIAADLELFLQQLLACGCLAQEPVAGH